MSKILGYPMDNDSDDDWLIDSLKCNVKYYLKFKYNFKI